MKVLYTAAHAVERSEDVALGGAASICRQFVAEWQRTQPFELQVLGPAILGGDAPSGSDLIRFGESAYARFCQRFAQAATSEILRHDPRRTVVLANDISEGPDFHALSSAGFPIATIFHVDVVAYVAAMYGRGWLKPETTVRWYDALERLWLPSIMKLVWAKQRDSVRYSRRLIVPSDGMRTILERCYPADAPGKVSVLPWGVDAAPSHESTIEAAARELREEFRVSDGSLILLTLSRISPEKNQELLLQALHEWERQPAFPAQPVVLFLCGGAAYMHGERYLQRLRKAASRLTRVRVEFPGHVTGLRKHAFFSLADLYVFPSRHESYGLTLLEAMQAGLPAVCLENSGSAEVMREELGVVVKSGSEPSMIRGLRDAIAALATDPQRRARMGAAARAYVTGRPFAQTAQEAARLLTSIAGGHVSSHKQE